MRLSTGVIAATAGIGLFGLAAFGLTQRHTVPQDFSAEDFKSLLVQSMSGEASTFGTAEAVEPGAFEDARAVFVQRFAHGAVTLFINGVSINTARSDLEQKLGVTCTPNADFEELPSRSGLILGKLSYSCTKAGEDNFAGYVLMIDEAARVSHLYQVVGHGIAPEVARAVTDRIYALLRKDYANWLVV
jgi:hypothetical protein